MRKVRRLDINDINLILNMNNDFREGIVVEEEVIGFLNNDNNFFYACIDNNKIVGFLYGYLLKRLNSKSMGYIHEVGVLDEYKKQGIATNLIKNAHNDLFNNGVVKTFLITQSNNIPACNLYEKMGGEMLQDIEHGLCNVSYVFKNNIQ